MQNVSDHLDPSLKKKTCSFQAEWNLRGWPSDVGCHSAHRQTSPPVPYLWAAPKSTHYLVTHALSILSSGWRRPNCRAFYTSLPLSMSKLIGWWWDCGSLREWPRASQCKNLFYELQPVARQPGGFVCPQLPTKPGCICSLTVVHKEQWKGAFTQLLYARHLHIQKLLSTSSFIFLFIVSLLNTYLLGIGDIQALYDE